MNVRWTEGAAEDLKGIVEYIGRSSEDASRRVAKALYDQTVNSAKFPRMGRRRGAENTYELVCVPWPYPVFIEGIVHTSRDRQL